MFLFGDMSYSYSYERARQAQEVLVSDGPVVGLVFASGEFIFCSSGVLCAGCGNGPNHSVAIAGYGGDARGRNPTGRRCFYWGPLNSWGGAWVAPREIMCFHVPGAIATGRANAFPSLMFPDEGGGGGGVGGGSEGGPFKIVKGNCQIVQECGEPKFSGRVKTRRQLRHRGHRGTRQ
ncbi:unnamed protein product [Prorocentrum cordatum]|uniref:Peptidase C1A papain C-terminal domain-containing protein n=1 Tax=Prorocentrum cordatum TaxID=2364126 RepID=A0ABN9SJ21_9DINO|nr:unnamed protein product [Polarella glacialis]